MLQGSFWGSTVGMSIFLLLYSVCFCMQDAPGSTWQWEGLLGVGKLALALHLSGPYSAHPT